MHEDLPRISEPYRIASVPIVEGPLSLFPTTRPSIVQSVVGRSHAHIPSGEALEYTLAEALYNERQRLRRSRGLSLISSSSWARARRDRRFWGGIQSRLLRSPHEVDRSEVTREVLNHYAEEISGHFSPGVYDFATRFVPLMFNWILNAASVRRIAPWRQTEFLNDRIRLHGEIQHLRELSKRGTILLVPTHQSNIDSIMVGYLIYLMGLPPFSYGAGLNLFMNPVLSFFMGNLGCYTVDRQKTNALYKESLKNYSTEILKRGVHSIFFPGGGRSRSGAIESHVKLGLLGTGLEAQLENLREGRPNPNVYVVPMISSYHFVFEAGSLMEDYLESVGKHRYLAADVDPPPFVKLMQFFWKFFASQSEVTIQLGRPLDVFGNFVDESGRSIGPNGTTIDPSRWLTTRGELRMDQDRDREYTRRLGDALVDRYYAENIVLSSHALAFTLFRAIRRKHVELDLFRFLRLSSSQREVSTEAFVREANLLIQELKALAKQGRLQLSPELQSADPWTWIQDGLSKLGTYHSVRVVYRDGDFFKSDDLSLLYYYRNRLSGYGLTMLAQQGRTRILRGEMDEKGFLG